jgi:hypothetical protein
LLPVGNLNVRFPLPARPVYVVFILIV